jgi:hypothetical protein
MPGGKDSVLAPRFVWEIRIHNRHNCIPSAGLIGITAAISSLFDETRNNPEFLFEKTGSILI